MTYIHHILIVEDNLEISGLLADFLSENGYKIIWQYDGLNVLGCQRQNKIELFV